MRFGDPLGLCVYASLLWPSISFINKVNVCGIWSKMLKDKLQSWMLRFSSSQIMDAMRSVYPHYWLQSYVKMTFP